MPTIPYTQKPEFPYIFINNLAGETLVWLIPINLQG
jgi:hypothetical protein